MVKTNCLCESLAHCENFFVFRDTLFVAIINLKYINDALVDQFNLIYARHLFTVIKGACSCFILP